MTPGIKKYRCILCGRLKDLRRFGERPMYGGRDLICIDCMNSMPKVKDIDRIDRNGDLLCLKCNRFLSHDAFDKYQFGFLGLSDVCKECLGIYREERDVMATRYIKDGKLKCSTCGQLKRPEDFHKRRAAKTGRQSQCKQCTREYRGSNPFANATSNRVREDSKILCLKCGEYFDRSKFYAQKGLSAGVRSFCKPCYNETYGSKKEAPAPSSMGKRAGIEPKVAKANGPTSAQTAHSISSPGVYSIISLPTRYMPYLVITDDEHAFLGYPVFRAGEKVFDYLNIRNGQIYSHVHILGTGEYRDEVTYEKINGTTRIVKCSLESAMADEAFFVALDAQKNISLPKLRRLKIDAEMEELKKKLRELEAERASL